jgi:hypothetical protein
MLAARSAADNDERRKEAREHNFRLLVDADMKLNRANSSRFEDLAPTLRMAATTNSAGGIHCAVTVTLKREPTLMFPTGVLSSLGGPFWSERVEMSLSRHEVLIVQALASNDW